MGVKWVSVTLINHCNKYKQKDKLLLKREQAVIIYYNVMERNVTDTLKSSLLTSSVLN